MKKSRLEIDYGFDFSLIGLRSGIRPHKLAWELNDRLGIKLARRDDHVLHWGRESAAFLHMIFETPLSCIRLLRNRAHHDESSGQSKWLLVPEHPEFDYFLLCSGKETDPSESVLQATKNIPTIEWSAFLPLASLRSKENFIF